MEHHQRERSREGWALLVSLGLHALLFVAIYYLPACPPLRWAASSGYSIALRTLPKPPAPEASAPPVEEATPSPAQAPEKAAVVPQDHVPQAAQPQEATEIRPTEEEAASAPEQVDERALYTNEQGQQAGAVLELTGWTWDTVPQPQDTTGETGKIVFEIKIDAHGELVSVKTLEKTISPWLEKVYREALLPLTFSKTSDSAANAAITTGKVTFTIQAQ